MKKAISENKTGDNTGCTRLFLLVWGLGFGGGGCLFFWLIFLSPYLNARAAATWPETTCKVLSSKVETHTDEDGTSYKPKITFEFTVDGVTYQGDRYSFDTMSGSSSAANKVVRANRKGSEQTCYYNPDAPDQSVMSRELDQPFFWTAIFPFVFITIGAIAIFAAIFWVGKKKRHQSVSGSVDTKDWQALTPGTTNGAKGVVGEPHPADVEDQAWSVPKKLKTEMSRLTMLLVTCGFAVFWNGIVSVFVYGLIFDGGGLWGRIGLGLFLTPFVLVGLVLLFAVVYMFMSLFNPKVEVAMSTGAVPLGGDVDIAWELIGNAKRIRKLKIEIQGQQSATYRRGTDTHTDTEVFEIIPVCEVTDQTDIQFGSTAVQIPQSTMHTFEANRNSVTWAILVKGEIPWWPDLTETFPFRVKPLDNAS